jgi:type II secretory pathway component GspD/PulD (secretin)
VSGEEHEIAVGDNIPIIQAAVTEGAGNALQNRINVQRQDVGVTLRVRPSLGQAGHVRLELEVEATRVTNSLAGDPELVGPTIEQRRVASTVWLSDDEIVVVGVGRFPEHATSVSGTPWLKDIPVLGHFFRVTRERTLNAYLLVTVQARVHTDGADLLAETIRRRLAMQRILSREGDLSAEDGPYALRLATRRVAADAEAVAAELARAGERTRVVRWDWQGSSHWDVYLVGFETPGELGDASLRARGGGWQPELVVVQDARAS